MSELERCDACGDYDRIPAMRIALSKADLKLCETCRNDALDRLESRRDNDQL